jgi:hypothetical protein
MTIKYCFIRFGIILLLALFNMCNTADSVPEEDVIEPDDEEIVEVAATMLFDETYSGLVEAARLGQRFPASDFYTTGLYMPAGSEASLNVEILQAGSGTPRLLIGTYSRYQDKWDPTQIDLKEGDNVIQAEKGGLLYIRYHSSSAEPAGKAEITFKGEIVKTPHYVLGETMNSEWQEMLDEYTQAPDVKLESNYGIIVASRNHAMQYRNENQEELLRILDRVFEAEFHISGLDGSSPEHQINTHKLLLTESDTENFFMAATWYRTFFHRNVVNHILTVDGLGVDGWGPWHEIGHMHQQGAWTWDTLGEVTVNIYSLAAEREMGLQESRLTRDGVWSDVAAFFSLPDGDRDFNSSASGDWVRLAMFHQLWLAYGDEFYQELHKITREEQADWDTQPEQMRYFMLKASEISGRDLSEFFRKWGFLVDEAVYSDIAALGLPQPEQDLATLTDDPNFEFPEENPLSVVDFSSEEITGEGGTNGRAARVVDGITGTYWHSRWTENAAEYPHFLTLELIEPDTIQGITFVQRDNGSRHVKDIEILISVAGSEWESMGHFTLDSNTSPQSIEFDEPVTMQQVRVIMNSSYDGDIFAAMDEILVY